MPSNPKNRVDRRSAPRSPGGNGSILTEHRRQVAVGEVIARQMMALPRQSAASAPPCQHDWNDVLRSHILKSRCHFPPDKSPSLSQTEKLPGRKKNPPLAVINLIRAKDGQFI